MKKVFCLLVAILIVVTSIFAVSSLDTTRVESKNLYTEEFKKYLNSCGLGLNEDYDRWYMYSEYYYYYSDENNTDIPEWVLAYGSYYGVEPSGCYGVFDEYCLQEVDCSVPNKLGYYIYLPTENEFCPIERAWSMNIDGIEKAFSECLVPKGIARVIGDADKDGKLSILDASQIQLELASLAERNDVAVGGLCVYGEEMKYITDLDKDGEIGILDATAIQLKLARLI